MYSLMLCHTGTSVHLLPPPGYWYTPFLLSGRSRSPTRKHCCLSVFAKSSVRCKYVFIPIPSLNHPHIPISKAFSRFHLVRVGVGFGLGTSLPAWGTRNGRGILGCRGRMGGWVGSEPTCSVRHCPTNTIFVLREFIRNVTCT